LRRRRPACIGVLNSCGRSAWHGRVIEVAVSRALTKKGRHVITDRDNDPDVEGLRKSYAERWTNPRYRHMTLRHTVPLGDDDGGGR
jgi:hypothetical protein